MNSILSSLKGRLVAGVLAGCFVGAPVLAVTDVLDTPAMMSDQAANHLLLDVTNVGANYIAVGARGHIILSEDDGDSWRQVAAPVSVMLTAVHFVDHENGWAVGHGGVVLHSSDGGNTWVKQFDGILANKSIIQQAQDVVSELEAQLEAASEDEIEELEYVLEEAQFALEDAQLDAEVGASKPFLDVFFQDKLNGFAVGAYGFIFKTEDGGETWVNYGDRMDNIDRFHLNAISAVSDALLVAGEAGVMFRSEDGGDTWETVESPYDGSFFGLIATGDKDVVLAFGLRGNLFRSEDAGQTWERLDTGTESTLMGAATDGSGKITVVGNSGSVLLSRDGGNSFEERIRENRLGNVSTVYAGGRRVLVVGESGLSVTTPAGENL
jgi:photosystem II stability/assembly factor-like uncharacterized protein